MMAPVVSLAEAGARVHSIRREREAREAAARAASMAAHPAGKGRKINSNEEGGSDFPPQSFPV